VIYNKADPAYLYLPDSIECNLLHYVSRLWSRTRALLNCQLEQAWRSSQGIYFKTKHIRVLLLKVLDPLEIECIFHFIVLPKVPQDSKQEI
jgi:hypothetical protein